MNKLSTKLGTDTPEGFGITAVTKLKHADLWSAAKRMGSQTALAKYLGIDQGMLGQWINLKRVPPAVAVGIKWTEEFITELEGKLAVLTGKSWDELFPDSLRRNAEFLDCAKTIEETAMLDSIALEHYATTTRQRLIHGDADSELRQARIEAIHQALECLTYREREIIILRYGLGDGQKYTLEEVGHIFKVTRSRIREIESRALRKLQQPPNVQILIDLI